MSWTGEQRSSGEDHELSEESMLHFRSELKGGWTSELIAIGPRKSLSELRFDCIRFLLRPQDVCTIHLQMGLDGQSEMSYGLMVCTESNRDMSRW